MLAVLVGLLDDADVAGHAIVDLRTLDCPAVAEAARPYLAHRRAWVRAEAGKTLARLDGAD